MPRIRKRVAIAVARNYAAGMLENAQCALLEYTGLTDDELAEMQAELNRLAKRIEATVNNKLLAQAASREEIARREQVAFSRS